jgi:spermidine synthase
MPNIMRQPHKFRGLIYAFFFISGFSALIYEVVWFHLLRLAIGCSSVSLTILLVSFMGGMFIGSLLFNRLFPKHLHPLKLYAALELAIGICGVLMLFLVPWVGHAYLNLQF